MFANAAFGCVIVVILLFELVYLPLKKEMNGTAANTETSAHQVDAVRDREALGGLGDPLSRPTSPKILEGRSSDDETHVTDVGRRVDPSQGNDGLDHPSASALLHTGDGREVVGQVNQDIASLQKQLTSISHDKAVGEAERQAIEAARAGDRLELENERKRASDLEDKSAAADRIAAAQSAVLRRQLEDEQARSKGLDQDLGNTRDQLTQMTQVRDDAERALRVAQLAHADDEATLTSERKAAADQVDRSRSDSLDTSSRAKALQLGGAPAHPVSLKRDGALATVQSEQAVRSLDQKASELTLMRQQLEIEHLSSAKLETALASAKQVAVQARLELAARDREQTAARAALAAQSGAQQTRAEARAEKVAADHVGAQLQAMQKQLAAERARSKALEIDVTRARSATSSSPEALAGGKSRLGTTDRIADGGAPQVGRPSLPDAAARLQATEAGLKTDGAVPPQQDAQVTDLRRQYASSARVPQAAPSGEGRDISSEAALPKGAQVNIVVHYSRDSQTARDRALILKTDLQSNGLSVEDAGTSDRYGGSDRVTFYYDEDRDDADRIAELSQKAKPVKIRLPRNRAVVPGTIDIVIAG